MIVQLQRTDVVATVDGVPTRVWQGQTQDGVPIVAFIHRIALATSTSDAGELERELLEVPPPSTLQRDPNDRGGT